MSSSHPVARAREADPPDAGRQPIPEFGFNAPGRRVPGFEAFDLAELRRRVPGPVLRQVHRADFHSITLVTRGSGEHTVDFVTHSCRPGTLLWVRPDQVHSFDPAGRLDGPHLVFTAAFPPGLGEAQQSLATWYGPACRQLGTGQEYVRIATLIAQLNAEFHLPGPDVSREILRHLLAALLLNVHRLPHRTADGIEGTEPGGTPAAGAVYTRFRAELELSYATVRRAEEYAARLGYTVKTLTRACLTATGHPVKQVIDARVALEAQRLLAHTDEPVATVGRRLGFSEPTNFGKFFTRLTGTTPGDFRRRHQGVVAS